jgi:uncharacterized membrane protein YjjP (DUF1212 family)
MSALADEKDEARAEAAHIHHANPKHTIETSAASVALASAVAAQKPDPWSRNMFKLYAIMGIGYLVSTMNGFGAQ